MSIQKIKESELVSHGVTSLPSRPSLPSLYEGRPLTAKELREAFDRLPKLLAERFNELLDSFGLPPEGKSAIADAIATGLFEGHSLADLFADMKNGRMFTYLKNENGFSLSDLILTVASPSGKVRAGEALGVSGNTVFEALEAERNEANAKAASLYRLSRVAGHDLSLCLEVNKDGNWQTVGETLVLPEDIFIQEGHVFTVAEDGVPEEGCVTGDKYLDLTLGGTEERHIYIKLSDLVDVISIKEEGEGDLVTSVSSDGNAVTVKKELSSTHFFRHEDMKKLEDVYVKKEALSDLMRKTALLCAAAEGNAFVYETDRACAYAKAVPEGAQPYALLSSLGGMSYMGNLVNERELTVRTGTTFSSVYDAEAECLVLNGTLSETTINYALCFLSTPIAAAGKTLSFSYYHTGGSFTSSNADVFISFGSGNENGMPNLTHGKITALDSASLKAEGETFADDAQPIDQFILFCSMAYGATGPAEITFTDYRLKIMVNEGEKAQEHRPFGLYHTAVTEIKIQNKNLIDEDIYDIDTWKKGTPPERITYPLTIPEPGRYTLSSAITSPMPAYVYLHKSTDGFQTFETKYLLTNMQNNFPYTFTANQGESYRLWTSKEWHYAIQDLQLERGDATEYAAGTRESFPIPMEVQVKEGYGKGISDTLYNYVDFEKGVFVRRVGERDYIDGDEDDITLLSDGIRTLYPLSQTEYEDISSLLFDGFLPNHEKGYLFFESASGKAVPSEITHQIKLTEGENA